MSKPKKVTKKDLLQYFITDFSVEICGKMEKTRYNKAWHKLWCRISKLGIVALMILPFLRPINSFSAWTTAWDNTLPLGSEAVSSGDDRMRELKVQLQERLGADHAWQTLDTTGTDTIGYHKYLHLLQQSTDPDTYLNVGILYQKSTGGKPTLYFRPDATGTAIRITDSTGLDSSQMVRMTGDQTVAGSKTFSAETTFSDTANFNDDTVFDSRFVHGLDVYKAPTLDREFSPKKYVDDQIAIQVPLLGSVQVDTVVGTSNISTASTSLVDMTDITYTDTFTASNVDVTFFATIKNFNTGFTTLCLMKEGVAVDTAIISEESAGGYGQAAYLQWTGAVDAASHTFKVQWRTSSGTSYQDGATCHRKLRIIRGLN
jgi:hypothetical protein